MYSMKNTDSINKNETVMTINIPAKKQIESITLFWAVTVVANSILGAFIYMSSSQNNYYGIAGMIAAIISCIAIYSAAEIYLRKANKKQLALELRISACIRILIQPITDFMIGVLAVKLTSSTMKMIAIFLNFNTDIFPRDLPASFISTYLTTLVHALLATFVVVCILGIVKMFIKLYKLVTVP